MDLPNTLNRPVPQMPWSPAMEWRTARCAAAVRHRSVGAGARRRRAVSPAAAGDIGEGGLRPRPGGFHRIAGNQRLGSPFEQSVSPAATAGGVCGRCGARRRAFGPPACRRSDRRRRCAVICRNQPLHSSRRRIAPVSADRTLGPPPPPTAARFDLQALRGLVASARLHADALPEQRKRL